MAVDKFRLSGDVFEKAIVLSRVIAGGEFCQSIILLSDLHLVELQTYLDCCDGIDFFSLRSIDHVAADLSQLIASYGAGIKVITVYPFKDLRVQVGSLRGYESNMIEVAEIRISTTDGRYTAMSPDPDRLVADQMRITGIAQS